MDLNAVISSLIGNNLNLGNTPTVNPTPISGPVNIAWDPSNFSVPDMGSDVKQAFQSLIPYYSKLLTESNGDFQRAAGRLQQDYQTGIRYNTQDVTMQTQRQQEDLSSALESLGIQSKQESDTQADTLNKRGIALTENNQTGKLDYGAAGQAGTEVSQLTENQRLRKEAEQRTVQRNLQDIGIKGQRQSDSLGQTYTRGMEDTTRQQQLYGEQLQTDAEQKAFGIAQQKQQETLQSQALNLNKSMLGGSGGSGGSDQGLGSDYYSSLWKSTGHSGDRPVGWFG